MRIFKRMRQKSIKWFKIDYDFNFMFDNRGEINKSNRRELD